ncbi:MAG: hypothetical protein ACRELY_09860 [Polyangiaceae bacterium]
MSRRSQGSVRKAQPKEVFHEDDVTRIGPPSKSDLPPPISGARAPRIFNEDDETRTGLPSKSDLPPPVDPQDAVDPDEAVTLIADPPRAKLK